MNQRAPNLASSFNFEVAIPVHCAYVIHISTCALCLCNPYQYEICATCYELISWVFN
jgi:hypothetical protein